MKPWMTIPLVLALNTFVDWTNPNVIMLIRVMYAVMSAAAWVVWNLVKKKIAEKNDTTTIWIKPQNKNPLAAFMGGGESEEPAKQTNYKDFEEAKASEQMTQALTGAAMQLFLFSMYLNIQLPLAMQVVQLPFQMLSDPTIRKHLMGDNTPTPYGESLTAPEAAAPADAATTTTSTAPVAVENGSAPAAAGAGDKETEDAIFSLWESREPADAAMLDFLASKGKRIATYATQEDKWTALMVVSGGTQNGASEVKKLLTMGAVPTAVDGDGQTAVHWAAFHGNPKAIEAICAHVKASAGGAAALASLLAMKDSKGHTAEEIAVAEKNEAAAAAIRSFRTAAASEAPVEPLDEKSEEPAEAEAEGPSSEAAGLLRRRGKGKREEA